MLVAPASFSAAEGYGWQGQVQISVLPAVVDALHAQAKVAANASFAIFIIFPDNLNGLSQQ